MRLPVAVAVLLGWAGIAHAAGTVTIGAIYPLGRDPDARSAIETAAEIVNMTHEGLEKLPLGVGTGLTGLGGAKIAVDFADDLDNPSVAEAQALRLITRDHVAALIGAGRSAETLAATLPAEHHGIPFLVPDAMAPAITGRGLKFVFRTTPLGSDIAATYVRFLAALKQAGSTIASVALVFEDTEHDRDTAGALRDTLRAAGFTGADIACPAKATDLVATVAQLRAAAPDAAIVISGAADAILLMKTMQNAGYKPPILIGDAGGFSDPAFATAVGNLAQGVIGRSVWVAGEPSSPAAAVNRLYKAKSGRDLDDTSARVLEGFLVLADAINRARSTDPEAIQLALQQTDLKAGQLFVGYDGVKFDASGQNTLAGTYLTQLQGKRYVAIWPAAGAEAKLELPFKGWE